MSVNVIIIDFHLSVVLQHIRQTVLQRAGSKGHMENVDEETEVKLAQVRRFTSFPPFLLLTYFFFSS